MRAFAGGQRREMAATAVARRKVSIALACRTFGVSETCCRYGPKLRDENEEIADLLVGLTEARKTWGFGLCFLHLRNVQGRLWNHKRVYRIYCELELNLRIKPRKRLKRDKPDALAVPELPDMTWSMDFMADRLGDGRAFRLYIVESIEEAQNHAAQWLWTYNIDRPNMGIPVTSRKKVWLFLEQFGLLSMPALHGLHWCSAPQS